MVHALTEAHRVLRRSGYVVDYRPDIDPGGRRAKLLDLFCIADGEEIPLGALVETSRYYVDYRAADRAVQKVLRRGFFTLESSEIARPRIYFRTLAALEDQLRKFWTGTTLGAATKRRLQAVLHQYPDAQILVRETFRMNVLKKR